jgi:soluble lytic murein transglycosylase-like protein
MQSTGLLRALGPTALTAVVAVFIAAPIVSPLPPAAPPRPAAAAVLPAPPLALPPPAPVVRVAPSAAAAEPRWARPPGVPAAVSMLFVAHPPAPAVPPPSTDQLGKSDAHPSTALGDRVPAAVRRWEPLIRRAAGEHALDPNLVAALMETESGGDPSARSPKGAVGLMQVLNGPTDPDANVRAGAKVLAENLRRYDGSVELALAAYNAGAGNVRKHGGVPPFPETRKHIDRTLASYERFAAAAPAPPAAVGPSTGGSSAAAA